MRWSRGSAERMWDEFYVWSGRWWESCLQISQQFFQRIPRMFRPCSLKNLGEARTWGNTSEVVGEVPKGLEQRASCIGAKWGCIGQSRVQMVQKTLGRPLLPGPKTPFAPSTNHFWGCFPIFGLSPKVFGFQPKFLNTLCGATARGWGWDHLVVRRIYSAFYTQMFDFVWPMCWSWGSGVPSPRFKLQTAAKFFGHPCSHFVHD